MLANFIGGKWLRPEGLPTLPVYNPASGEVIAQIPQCSAAEVAEAVAAAARAHPAWAATSDRLSFVLPSSTLRSACRW